MNFGYRWRLLIGGRQSAVKSLTKSVYVNQSLKRIAARRLLRLILTRPVGLGDVACINLQSNDDADAAGYVDLESKTNCWHFSKVKER